LQESPKKSIKEKLILVGVGQTAFALAKAALSNGLYDIYGCTRSENRKLELEDCSINPVFLADYCRGNSLEQLSLLCKNAYVLISFPPDGKTDQLLAPALKDAKKLVYISSTGVYGNYCGPVDESTPTDKANPKAAIRIEAENTYLGYGGIILRAPGLYGENSGLHKRLTKDGFTLGSNSNTIFSRIHLDDLAQIILAAFNKAQKHSVYLVGDLLPASLIEVTSFLCQQMNLPMPTIDQNLSLHETQRYGRQVNPEKVLTQLSVQLKYPNYKEGYAAILAKESTNKS
jgi:hypothetical protein